MYLRQKKKQYGDTSQQNMRKGCGRCRDLFFGGVVSFVGKGVGGVVVLWTQQT